MQVLFRAERPQDAGPVWQAASRALFCAVVLPSCFLRRVAMSYRVSVISFSVSLADDCVGLGGVGASPTGSCEFGFCPGRPAGALASHSRPRDQPHRLWSSSSSSALGFMATVAAPYPSTAPYENLCASLLWFSKPLRSSGEPGEGQTAA